MKPVMMDRGVESSLSSLLKTLQYSVQCEVASAAEDVADEQLRIVDFFNTNLAQVTRSSSELWNTSISASILRCTKVSKNNVVVVLIRSLCTEFQ